MKSILIKDTTREEREQIVKQALWGSCGAECEFCSGCDNRGGGRIETLYQPYIDGEKEIAEINAFIGAYLRLEALLKLKKYDILLRDIKELFGNMEKTTGTLWEYRQRHGSRDHGFASYALVAMMKGLKNQ